jgi:hypothetical protein
MDKLYTVLSLETAQIKLVQVKNQHRFKKL